MTSPVTDGESPSTPAEVVFQSQIICGALIGGVGTFLFVTMMVKRSPKPPEIAYIAALVAAGVIGLRFVVPNLVAAARLKSLAGVNGPELDLKIYLMLMTKLIIGLALLEGGAFFNLISYMLEGQIWTLAIVGVLVLLMAIQFPTVNTFQAAADDAKREVQSHF